jgi:hypothetical protein
VKKEKIMTEDGIKNASMRRDEQKDLIILFKYLFQADISQE